MSIIYLERMGGGELALNGGRIDAGTARVLDRARDILRVAREEAEQIRRDAHDAGFRAGFDHGHAEMASLLAEAHVKAGRQMRELQPVLVNCVVDAVRLLVSEAEYSQVLERAAMHVKERLGDASGMVLRVSGAGAEAARQAAERLVQREGLALPVRVVTDTSLQENCCVLESSLGRAEVCLEDQLARLRAMVEMELSRIDLES